MARPIRRPAADRRPPLLLFIGVVVLVVVAAISVWRSTARPKETVTQTPELKAILSEWEKTPRGRQAKATMQARLQRGRAGRPGPAGQQPTTR